MNKEIKDLLDANIPEDVVRTRQQAGASLSYVETWYVIDRLNQILGTDSWSHEVIKLEQLGTVKNSRGEEMPAFLCQARLTVNIQGAVTFKDGIGYGIGKAGNPLEIAIKEAESDALKRAAKNLGRSLGLALYDKSQQFVGEAEPKPEVAPAAKPSTVPDAAATQAIIKAAFNILQQQKKTDAEGFKKQFLNNQKLVDLDAKQSLQALDKLKQSFPELKL